MKNLTNLGYRRRPATKPVKPGYSTKAEFAHPGMFVDPDENNVEVMSDGDEGPLYASGNWSM